MKSILHAVPLAVALIALPAHALKEVVPPPAVRATFAKKPEVLKGAKFFEAPGGLIGIVTFPPAPAQPAVIYVTADGRGLIVGMIIDTVDGKNLTAEAASQFAPGSPIAKAGEKLEKAAAAASNLPQVEPGDPVPTAAATPAALDKLAYIETGSGERVIYAFVDPQCKHCKNAFTEISTWQKGGGKTRIRWVPISLGNEQSTSRAAQALGNRTLAGLDGMFNDAPMVKDQVAKGALLLERNMEFIDTALPLTATPVFVYVDGGKVTAKTGFAGLAGMQAKKP